MGIAIASGVPLDAGLLSGIIGGIVVALLRGAPWLAGLFKLGKWFRAISPSVIHEC
jgi:MFS superfamily sulfate permease-like transporter